MCSRRAVSRPATQYGSCREPAAPLAADFPEVHTFPGPRPSPFRLRIGHAESHPRISHIRADGPPSLRPSACPQGSSKALWVLPRMPRRHLRPAENYNGADWHRVFEQQRCGCDYLAALARLVRAFSLLLRYAVSDIVLPSTVLEFRFSGIGDFTSSHISPRARHLPAACHPAGRGIEGVAACLPPSTQ